jgi:putative addiction module component (TIGR02574 family)
VSKIPATVDDLEATVLALPEPERVRLAGSLVRSLTTGEEAIRTAWLDEAERRDREMGEDPDSGVPAEEVLRKVRSRLG